MEPKTVVCDEKVFPSVQTPIDAEIDEKIRLWTKCHKEIKEMSKEKDEYAFSITAQKISDEEIIKKKATLCTKIIFAKNQYLILRSEVAGLIIRSSASACTKLKNSLGNQIMELLMDVYKLKQKLKSPLINKIFALYNLSRSNIALEPKVKGISGGFIIRDKPTNLRIFVKSSKAMKDESKNIDQRELYAYKILEKMGLGPQAQFILTPESASTDKIKCYFTIKDVAYTEVKGAQIEFHTDGTIHDESPLLDVLDYWCKALESQMLRSSLLTLSTVNDILHLNDTLMTSAGNYGITLLKSKGAPPHYTAMIVDLEIEETLYKFEPNKNPVVTA